MNFKGTSGGKYSTYPGTYFVCLSFEILCVLCGVLYSHEILFFGGFLSENAILIISNWSPDECLFIRLQQRLVDHFNQCWSRKHVQHVGQQSSRSRVGETLL